MESAKLSGWLHLLACPGCEGNLHRTGENSLACASCSRRFPIRGDIPSLVSEGKEAELKELMDSYRRARLEEGWSPMTEQELLNLPQGSPAGYPPLYWSVRRQTFRIFAGFLQREGPGPHQGAAADLGAGTGWLAHRLAGQGYHILAMDASLDRDFGLGASDVYRSRFPQRLLAVQCDLNALPLQKRSFSLVIFNASLHYAQDLGGTLDRAARALRPGGSLVILDTPVARYPHAGCRIGDRHLGRGELDRALQACGLQTRYVRVGRGPRWHLYRLRAALRGDSLFSFPMVIGSVPGSGLQDDEA